jgi:hypothetical protein
MRAFVAGILTHNVVVNGNIGFTLRTQERAPYVRECRYLQTTHVLLRDMTDTLDVALRLILRDMADTLDATLLILLLNMTDNLNVT